MRFLYPAAFWALLPLALVFLTVWWRRRSSSVAFSDLAPLAGAPSSLRVKLSWLPGLLGGLGAIGLVTALSRPQMEMEEVSAEREGIAIEMLVDISSSMDMRMAYKEGEATRLAVAKEVLEMFVTGDGEELKGRPDDMIGIITFARYADTVCPLTLSHGAVVEMARELAINDRPNEDGTAYGDASSLAAARLERVEEALAEGAGGEDIGEIESKVIVLLTDGENNCGRHLPLESAALAKKWGIRIYTVSISEPPRPKKIEAGEGGETIEVAREKSSAERVLEKMAEETGGIFRTAHDFDSLQAVYAEIDRLERSEMRATVKKVWSEKFVPIALLSLILLVADGVLRATWLRRAP